MTGKARTILFAAILVLFIAGSAWLYNNLQGTFGAELQVENSQGEVEPGDDDKPKAPDFTVYDMDGNAVKLSDMEGKPVVLNFWASWCPPCKSEMPHFDAVYEELGADVQFMMVDLVDGSRETTEKGSAYIAEQEFGFPVFFDTSGEAAQAYGIRSIPTTVFIDKQGYAITGAQGAIDEELLRKGIDMIK